MNQSSCVFEIIDKTLKNSENRLSVSSLCKIAAVSRSGYYAWIKAKADRQAQEEQDRRDFELILAAFKRRGYEKGARTIYMELIHQNPPVIMNIKKIRRLMKKFRLYCPIRKANPYRRMSRSLATSHVAPNIVNRKFKREPRRVLLTDITYLFYSSDKCFLSTILDAFTHEVLGYCVSVSLKIDFVIETVNRLINEHGSTLDNETIVHSDQGSHYTSYAFIQKLEEEDFIQSMSRRGNCWDNSPQESFFGHMKDEIRKEVSGYTTFEEVEAKVDDWMDYYNNDRYQWDLLKLSPREYYQYLQSGIYPLPVHSPNKK